MAQTDMKVIDPATGETVGPDVDGELCTRGYFAMMGYFDNPDATAATIDADGWLHTGDLAAMDSRGYCRITGRLKDMIIRGGENIYPKEIEQVLFEHEDVADVAVVGVPDPTWGEQVVRIRRDPPTETRLTPTGCACTAMNAWHRTRCHFIGSSSTNSRRHRRARFMKFLLRERFAASAPDPTVASEDQEELLASLRSARTRTAGRGGSPARCTGHAGMSSRGRPWRCAFRRHGRRFPVRAEDLEAPGRDLRHGSAGRRGHRPDQRPRSACELH